MWPFDKLLTKRITDLERSLEIMTGANDVLSRELEKAQEREAELLDKIFTLTGINKTTKTTQTEPAKQPISISKKTTAWPQIKQTLELQAREDYWKTKEAQAKSTEQLEKEVLGEDNAKTGSN